MYSIHATATSAVFQVEGKIQEEVDTLDGIVLFVRTPACVSGCCISQEEEVTASVLTTLEYCQH